MIERVRRLCHGDGRLMAAMMYGSFAQGEGDEFSDVEVILFFKDEALEELDPRDWICQIAPVELYFVNEFGIGTAIFENLGRGEFHFDKASDIRKINESWNETDWSPSLDDTLLLDRTGELTRRLQRIVGPPLERDTPERIRFLCNSLVNWILFGLNLLARGELARALTILGSVQVYLLRMVRVLEGSTVHWATPSKLLEQDLSEASYARYAACTARLDKESLNSAYVAAWIWGRTLTEALSEKHGTDLPATLLDSIDEHLNRVCGVLGEMEP